MACPPSSVRPFINQARVHPKATPIPPPLKLRKVASATNCSRISRRLAPMALRMPISRVRSVTDTSMMFIMPIPPTSREMLAMAPKNITKVLVVSSRVSRVSCRLVMVKSSSPVIRCRSRSTVATSWIAWSMSATSGTWTLMVFTLTPP